MKKTLLFLLLTTFPVFASIPIEVVKVVDGDTIKAKIDSGNKFSIRLIGINCYETSKIHRAYKQAYLDKLDIDEVVFKGREATKYLKTLQSQTKRASFDFRGIDKYGRVLGIVYFDKINVNENLIKNKVCASFEFVEK